MINLNVITNPVLQAPGRNIKFALWLVAGLLLHANVACAQGIEQKMMRANESEAYKKLLLDAGDLLKVGNAASAYALLEPFEFEHSGKENFDYLLGVAALDSGRPDRATLAFERVLMLNPSSAAARMEMARAYYQLGDMPRARTEFENVLKVNQSEAVQNIIQKYLEAIALHESGKKTHFSAYIEGTLGYDNNVNNSTSQLQIYVDAIAANAVLDPTNVKTADQYQALAMGGEVVHELNAKLGIFAGANFRQRSFTMQKSFNVQGWDARSGMTFNLSNDRFKLGVLGGQNSLGGAHYSDSSVLKGDWQHVFSPSNQLNVFVQRMKYNFADVVMQPNDYIQQVSGAGWVHVLPDGKASLFANVYAGNEQDTSTLVTTTTPNGGRVDGAKSLQGIRIGGQIILTDKTTLFANIGMQNGAYSKINPLFLRQREDRLYDMAIGTNWRWDKWWTLRTQLNYFRNESNIPIYEYDRTDVSLAIRRDFR